MDQEGEEIREEIQIEGNESYGVSNQIACDKLIEEDVK